MNDVYRLNLGVVALVEMKKILVEAKSMAEERNVAQVVELARRTQGCWCARYHTDAVLC